MILILIYIFSLFMVFYAYFGYPLSLLLVRIFRQNEQIRQGLDVSVTLIITVYNEEKKIRKKLENTLQLDYPAGKLHILVASDGSTDATNDIVRSFEAQGVEHKRGKQKHCECSACKKERLPGLHDSTRKFPFFCSC